MTPVEKARLALQLAEADERLAAAKDAGDPDALRAVKHEVRELRAAARAALIPEITRDDAEEA